MIDASWKHWRLSRMMLGTVQFGLPYGVANRTGQPTYKESLRIVAAAIEGGVNCFDTAAAYGTSEEVLGRALRELRVAERTVVFTKVQPLSMDSRDAQAAAAHIERSVDASRRRLQLDCLPAVLFHREPDASQLDSLLRLRDRGWLQHCGVSCDNRPGPAEQFLREGAFAALQIPGNLLDRRHQQSGVFASAERLGVGIIVRSVFLQGLLVMPESHIPPSLRAVVPLRHQLEAIASEAGLSLPELAVRYLLAQPGVTCVLTGVETLEQVRDNLRLFERGPLDEATRKRVDAVRIELPEAILSPSTWPGLAATGPS